MRDLRWGAGLAALTGFCAVALATYALAQPTEAANATASLTLNKGYTSGFGVAGSQSFSLTNAATCEDLQPTVGLFWSHAASKRVDVAASRPLIIFIDTTYRVGGVPGRQSSCDQKGQFTPIAGHRYAVTSRAPAGRDCHIEVIDEATGRTPDDLQAEDGAACLREYTRARALKTAR